jgi:hypothetical protein
MQTNRGSEYDDLQPCCERCKKPAIKQFRLFGHEFDWICEKCGQNNQTSNISVQHEDYKRETIKINFELGVVICL